MAFFPEKDRRHGHRMRGLPPNKWERVVQKHIQRLARKVTGEIPASYIDFLKSREYLHYADHDCDVYADPGIDSRHLYHFKIRKFLSVNPDGSEDLSKNYQEYRRRLPAKSLLPIAFDQFRNVMCIDTDTGEIFFWDAEQEVDQAEISLADRKARLFYVARTFSDFKARLYKSNRYT
ncbi:MAG: SMI1/KNR4 family protein [Bacteroidetes bacterium]|jgi:hypothetical protein|nr:SMI1/KNR4 family protein [Bacteroidota bacterium]